MSGYDLFLVEVTHLHWNITKDASDSRSTIGYNGWYFESLAFYLSSGSVIGLNSFIINFFPEDILFDSIGSENQDSILPAKVSRIGHNDSITRNYIPLWQLVVLQLFADPIWASVMISSELTDCSSLKYKSTPDCFLELYWSSRVLKVFVTALATKALRSSTITFFDYIFWKTEWTFFLTLLPQINELFVNLNLNYRLTKAPVFAIIPQVTSRNNSRFPG